MVKPVMNVRDYARLAQNGDWTDAFAEAARDVRAAGGGTLHVPAGIYESRSIELYSFTTLRLDNGAVIRFFPDPSEYETIDMEFEGIPGKAAKPLIFADGARSVRVTGEGVLDGNGAGWWRAFRENSLRRARPSLVCFRNCRDVELSGLTLVNSPAWTVHPLYCDHVTVRGVTIRNPADSPNTDGINPNGCADVRIADCLIDVGDDCIAIKAGTEDTPRKRPCENIIVSGCQMRNGHGGVVIGSETSGCVRNVLVTGCAFQGTDRGIRVKTRRGRGGVVENLSFSQLLMDGVACPLVMNMRYFCGKGGKEPFVRAHFMPVDEGTPVIRDVEISGVTAIGVTACAGFLHGLAEMPIERVNLSRTTVTLARGFPAYPAMMDGAERMEARGLYARNARDIVFSGVRVVGQSGDAYDLDESVRAKIEG